MDTASTSTDSTGIAGVGEVVLAVADLDRMIRFYQDIIGLIELDRTPRTAALGIENRTLIYLESRPGGIMHPNATGLFHLALLLPGRPELGRWLRHLIDKGYPLEGAGDHLVSEALYLRDPEGNGIEIYSDRPRSTWKYDGDQIRMATLPVDYRSLLNEAAGDSHAGLPPETRMGHVHLQVNDIERTVKFYRDVVGFEIMAYMPGAGFVGAGGYHHHVGMNVWNSRGASPPPDGSLGLVRYTLVMESEQARSRLIERAAFQNTGEQDFSEDRTLRDPAGNAFLISIDNLKPDQQK